MANTDFIQATIEIFGAIMTAIIAMIFWIITRNRKRSEKTLFSILLVSGFLLLMDAGWYMFDGNITAMGFALNWFCNLALFLCNPIMVILVIRYVCSFMKEEGNTPNKVPGRIAYLLAAIAFLIPISNVIYNWMYYFDAQNIYHRMTGWYVYTVVNSLSIVVCAVLVFAHGKYISGRRRIALTGFFLAPFLGIALQALLVGISFIQLGTALGSIFIIANYLIDWIRAERKGSGISEDRKKIWLIECVFFIMILFVSAAIITCAVSVNNVSNENSAQNSTSLAYMVSETVESTLSEPINVSKTMAQSEIVIDALSEENVEQTQTEAKLLAFMTRIKEKYGYQMIFVASDKTKGYYTYEGFSRYMDVSATSVDSWYYDFVNKGAEYELNIDADKDNDMSLAVFVNMEVRGRDGEFLGICGVAMSIESLMDMLAQYEEQYHLGVSLINQNGLIQVDTDRNLIENQYYDMTMVEIANQDITYKRVSDKAILTKNMGACGWYLIVEDYVPDKLSVLQMILPSLIIYILGVTFMLVFSLVFGIREIRRSRELQDSKLESQTAQAESYAKGRFLANMSHEIRTPINAILGMDTMILRESHEPRIKEYAMIIQNSGNILLSLINDILDISKIESGKMEIVPENYDFSVLISDVMNMISTKADKKGLDVNLEIDRNLPTGLYGDDVRIRQIMVNLMNNAVKYTEQGSVTLQVGGEVADDLVKLNICVKDTGIGIKEEDIQKLFEDFVRIDETRNKNIEGTGLGMSITVQLLELMHSKLEVASKYGEGSEFSFVIEQKVINKEPIGDIAQRLKQKAEIYEYVSCFTAPQSKILVVDDNDVNRVVFLNLLKETGVQIDEADCGKNALDLVFAQKYDIIFLDHMMPDMDGIEVMQHIKESTGHPNVDTPVIVLTANAISGARETYLAAGFNDYLSKPIIPEQLEKMISDLLPAEKKMEGERKAILKPADLEMPMVEGVDWNYAKLHLTDNAALMNTLKGFVLSIEAEADNLQQLYDELLLDETNPEVLDLYRIKVHAMKSTSTLIGCVPLAGMAATLEMAAKAGQFNVIRDLTQHFINTWRGYRDKLFFAIEPVKEKQEIEDRSLIVDYLNQLKDAIQVFDVHGADSVLEKLKQYQYTVEMESTIDKMEIAVNNLDIEEVVLLCEEAFAQI